MIKTRNLTITMLSIVLTLMVAGAGLSKMDGKGSCMEHSKMEHGDHGEEMEKTDDGKVQTLEAKEAKIGEKVVCPVMKEEFKVTKKSFYVSYKGKKYYFCCKSCVA